MVPPGAAFPACLGQEPRSAGVAQEAAPHAPRGRSWAAAEPALDSSIGAGEKAAEGTWLVGSVLARSQALGQGPVAVPLPRHASAAKRGNHQHFGSWKKSSLILRKVHNMIFAWFQLLIKKCTR